MPSISDPGHELVVACIKEDIPVVALPGPTAGMTALIASGLVPQPFLFYGFLPRKKKEQQDILASLVAQESNIDFYESPYRVAATLTNMLEVFGNRQVVLCRELTKIHEEYLRGDIEELLGYFRKNSRSRENAVLLVEGSNEEIVPTEQLQGTLKEQVQQLIDQGEKPNGAIKTRLQSKTESRNKKFIVSSMN